MTEQVKLVALAGNPNVGKSTVFNSLTGLRQHTGNWPGKTVEAARGSYRYRDITFQLVDLPGSYSLLACSPEEEAATATICQSDQDVTVIVVDATCLERNLSLALQILRFTKHAVLCVNLIDEARKRRIQIDFPLLSSLLGIPVVATSARSGKGIANLRESIYQETLHPAAHRCSYQPLTEAEAESIIQTGEQIYLQCVSVETKNNDSFDRKLDRILTSRTLGYPVMVLFLILIFWITLSGANVPTRILTSSFAKLQLFLHAVFVELGVPSLWTGLLLDGMVRTVAWVVAVMLPPMAIFFPLFALLEDSGYLPRIAFNMDRFFRRANAHGKQALTMCMGFGCNACGVSGCRIIDSPRERLVAILTNNFVPCNGRFPTLIALITLFFTGSGAVLGASTGVITILPALFLTALILLGILMTGLVSWLLSQTLLKGLPSSFVLELPPYRRPQFFKVILRSFLDRTVFVLLRAVTVAAPAGLLIYLLANTQVQDQSILFHCTEALDPLAWWFGLDGVILLAFLLGFPANEIVIPIMVLCYQSAGSLSQITDLEQLRLLFLSQGWTWVTALCVLLLCLMHFPCGTTCWTIKKETRSLQWTAMAMAIPTGVGLLCCFLVAALARLVS